jgi:RNA binding exosome subunit
MFKISKLLFSVLSYHTELEHLVNNCLITFIPEPLVVEYSTSISIDHMKGQFDDKIKFHKLEVKKSKHIKEVLQHVFSKLSEKDFNKIFQEFGSRYDEDSNKLHLRFDKFKASEGLIETFIGSDIVKFEIKYDVYTTATIEELEQELRQIIGV